MSCISVALTHLWIKGLNSRYYQNVAGPSFSQQERTTYPYRDAYLPVPALEHSCKGLPVIAIQVTVAYLCN